MTTPLRNFWPKVLGNVAHLPFFKFFSSKKMLLSDCSSGYPLTTCFDFVLKIFGLLHSKREKNYTKKKFSQKNFPAKTSWYTIEGCFENFDKTFGRSSKSFIPIAFLNLIFSNKSFFGLPFYTCRLQFGPRVLNFRQEKIVDKFPNFQTQQILAKKRQT